MAVALKNPPAIAGSRFDAGSIPGSGRSPGGGQEDPLGEGRTTHSTILAWRIPWTEEPGRGYSPLSLKESDTTEVT